ncbi:MAG: 50S ribosomal protein L31e [Promethearchaeota archaeon]
MAKKKVIIKATEEELKKATEKKEAGKRVAKVREKGKKSKKKTIAQKEDKISKKTTKKKKATSKAEEKIKDLSIDELVEDLDTFEEEEPSELEREMEISETQFEEEIAIDRIYNVHLSQKFMKAPKWKRTKRAMAELKKFVTRHMKPDLLYIDPEVNERIWENGIKNPPRKIRIRVTKSVEGYVRVFLA